MSRIMGIAKENTAPEIQALYESQETLYGNALNNLHVYALRPTIRQGTAALAAGIEASGLIEDSLKKLVSLKAALINGCPF
jgi:hypothetical protein